MSIADGLLTEFEQEAKTTRKFLEQVPEDHLNWQPHEKSMSLGALAWHIAVVPGNIAKMALENIVPAPDFKRTRPTPASYKEILDAFEQSIATVRELLPTFDDRKMMETWQATRDGKPILSMPRAAFLRSIMLNHWYHHRGQLGVYLRLVGARVPSSYGPSGDELPAFLTENKK